jgi:hypothetical protein
MRCVHIRRVVESGTNRKNFFGPGRGVTRAPSGNRYVDRVVFCTARRGDA